jgi:hypothetical protein
VAAAGVPGRGVGVFSAIEMAKARLPGESRYVPMWTCHGSTPHFVATVYLVESRPLCFAFSRALSLWFFEICRSRKRGFVICSMPAKRADLGTSDRVEEADNHPSSGPGMPVLMIICWFTGAELLLAIPTGLHVSFVSDRYLFVRISTIMAVAARRALNYHLRSADSCRVCGNCLEAKPANERWSHKTGMTLCRACDVYQARYGVGIHIAASHAADPNLPACRIGCCIGDVCVCRLGWGAV